MIEKINTFIHRLKELYEKAEEIGREVYYYFFRSQVTMSNSRLNMCSTCPLKYKFYYEDGLKGFPSAPLHFGSVIHKALKEYHLKFDLKGQHGTLDDLIREYEIAWKDVRAEMLDSVSGPPMHRWKVALAEAGCTMEEVEDTMRKFKIIYNTMEDEAIAKKRGLKLLEDYFKDNQANPNRIIAVEKPLTITIKGLDILAYIDRIEKTPEGEIEVVDYKSGQRVQDEETILLGGDNQALIYTMMVEKKWKKRLRNFYYYYLKNGNKVPCNPPKRLKDKIFNELWETAQDIKHRRFEPHQGPLCGWCDYEVICPTWKGNQAPFKGIFRAARERGRMTFSYSKMSCYRNCPYNYKKLYIDKISPKPKNFFAIGHACHETFEEFFTYPYQPSLTQLRKMYENHWHSEGYRDVQEERKFFEDGWKWVSSFYKKYYDGHYLKAAGVELYFQLPIGDDYIIIGYIDRLQKNLDGTYEILDYKTDPKLRTQEELDKDLQLTSYYWAMRQLGIDVKQLSLEFLQFNQRMTTKRTPEDIPVFIDEVNKTIGEMASKEEELKKHPEKADILFPPKVNKYCGGCDHLIGCPMENEIRTTYREKVMNLEEKKGSEDKEEDEKEEKEEEKFEK
ncbi:MAG: PD-(D/E)XK nuclease family protein [Elusimicrobia bacterium]|nr:PD-(D/E)XK nuclease family protein [Elusimicrobiota bacterium]